MFDHVTIGAADRATSRAFYATVLPHLGLTAAHDDPTLVEWHDFSIAPAGEDRPVTTGLHVGFRAPSPAHVEAFWRAGVEAGYRDDGAPGPRPQYTPDYVGAFLLDPDGNSAEAVTHGGVRTDGVIDHLWVRVADVAASRRFYDLVAPHAGFAAVEVSPDLVRYGAGPRRGSFTLLAGEPTAPFHLAFRAPEPAAVAAFHRSLTAAGFPDNGGPGERPEYHPGYVGAFVLDPDGQNVELVHHGRG